VIVSILNWESEKTFDPQNTRSNEVLPQLQDLLHAMMSADLRYSEFLRIVESIRSRQPKWNVLAIDGGGSRGIVSAMILEELGRLLQKENKEKDSCDLWREFHLIGGTSAGGLNALAVGAMKKKSDEIVKVAEDVSRIVFPDGFSLKKHIFSPNKPTKALQEKLKNELGENVLFRGKNGVDPIIFVCTVLMLNDDKVIIGEKICNFPIPV
jgi:hypothetical protein